MSESEKQEIFACGMWNPGLKNPESKFHRLKESGIQYLESEIHSVDSRTYATYTSPIMHLICPPKFCISIAVIPRRNVQVAYSPSWMTLHGASNDRPSIIQIELIFRRLPSITANSTQFSNMFIIL